jgi:hypothetical protein
VVFPEIGSDRLKIEFTTIPTLTTDMDASGFFLPYN